MSECWERLAFVHTGFDTSVTDHALSLLDPASRAVLEPESSPLDAFWSGDIPSFSRIDGQELSYHSPPSSLENRALARFFETDSPLLNRSLR